jgi:TorA maturation chaperone TorD
MKEADARRANRCDEVLKVLKGERRFLEEHLLSWVGDFFKNVRESDRTGYYRAWVDLTEGWLLFDLKQLSKTIDTFGF